MALEISIEQLNGFGSKGKDDMCIFKTTTVPYREGRLDTVWSSTKIKREINLPWKSSQARARLLSSSAWSG